MPELPDVEARKRYVDSTALHSKISGFELTAPKLLEGITPTRFSSSITDRTLEEAVRHGKYLFIRLDSGKHLILHFGMTGDLSYFKDEEDTPEYTCLRLEFENGYYLAYTAPRKLGRIGVIDSLQGFLEKKSLGPDALSISREDFRKLFTTGRGAVKSVFMNQKKIAGVGNIYTDEVLFQAEIHPETDKRELGPDEIDLLYDTMREVLTVSIDRNAEVPRLPEEYLIPHRDEEEDCPRCGGPVARIIVGGRSTYLCPKCQKKK
jgi:formamidopyrimidine-DNA glycosylase